MTESARAAAVAELRTSQGRLALALAAEQPDPSSLAAASVLRARFPAELAAIALTQADLRRQAVRKFGPAAADMFFTRAGLEQATRPEVAAHRATRFAAAGAQRVVDLGCGIGSDALALVAAELAVVAVEIDEVTAEIARLNLRNRAAVLTGDAERLAGELLDEGTAAFCDPARRTADRRLWRVVDFRPSWDLVTRLLSGDRVAGVKLGPALPTQLIPPGVEAEWVSSGGDTVEVGLWAGAGSLPGARVAMVLPSARMVVSADVAGLVTSPPGRYLYEPDGAVIRAGGIAELGQSVHGWLLDPKIAYVASDHHVFTPFAAVFEIEEVLPYQEKALRRWLRDRDVGSVEIKKRGVDIDPARLRPRLQLSGTESCTLILSRTPTGAVALIARRLPERHLP